MSGSSDDTSGAAIAGFIIAIIGFLTVLGAPIALYAGVVDARTNDEVRDGVILTFIGLAIFPILGGLLGMGGIDNARRHGLGGVGLGKAAQILSIVSLVFLALYGVGVWAEIDEALDDDDEQTTADNEFDFGDFNDDSSTQDDSAVEGWVTDAFPRGDPAEIVSMAANVATVLDPGLLCADVKELGYNYGVAYEYWVREGEPDRMDENVDGIPCQTVYAVEEIDHYASMAFAE